MKLVRSTSQMVHSVGTPRLPLPQPCPVLNLRTVAFSSKIKARQFSQNVRPWATRETYLFKPIVSCLSSSALARCYGSLAHRYLDPKNDLAFKRIFGADKHKSIPMDFLNAVFHLRGPHEIVELEFLNPVQTPEIDARKESIVDVLVRDQKGTKYIIEMQVASVEGFEKRAQYYAAKTYCAHFGRGKKYEDLKKVIFLAITDYTVFPRKEGYKSDHVILDNITYENDLKDFYFTFVELPKFTKTVKELKTVEDKWYFFLKHADESENIRDILSKHPEIREAYTVLDRSQWSEEDLFWYEKNVLDTADRLGIIAAAKSEGKQLGLVEGRVQGKTEGRAEGRAEGQAEGEKEKTHQIAIRLLKRKQSVEEIADVLGMSLQEVQELAVKNKI